MEMVAKAWPNPVSINPAPLAIETFRSRFRDAVRGVMVYSVGGLAMRNVVAPWWKDYTIKESKGLLLVGPKTVLRQTRKGASEVGLLVSGIATLEGDTVDSPDKDVIRAIGLLVTYGILSDARLTGVTEEFIYDCLGSDYSGGVVENADGTLTIF